MTDKPIILIVDDEPANIQILAACLKDKYNIKVATSGEQCMEIVDDPDQIMPDLILMDIEMPGKGGYEACRCLKENTNYSSTPVIFVTARDGEGDEEKGLLLGAVDYITKPVNPAIVMARVDTHITLKQQRDELKKMALHDQLTGLYNRYYLLEEANHKVAQAMRHKHSLSLLMMDIDHFKIINDEHGHPAGDAVLQSVAKLLKELNRIEDITARFGGEEFVIVLDHCNAENAEAKAEIIRQKIEASKPEDIKVTVSIGVAELRAGEETFSDLLKRADIALYLAKEQGRNRVILSEFLPVLS